MTRAENNPPSGKKLNIVEWLNDVFVYFKIRLSVNPKKLPYTYFFHNAVLSIFGFILTPYTIALFF